MIQLENVSKVFGTGVAGLSDITLLIEKGEFVFLVGHTGSGKTTLLRLLVRDMLPTSGTIIVGDLDVVKLPSGKIPHLRKKIGVIFQDLKLLTDQTILENVTLPMQVASVKVEEANKRGQELLELVGLGAHLEKFPVQLSGGELQRVAIARALALSPDVLLADEPTGNLDPKTADEIVGLLQKLNEELGTTIIMATHNLDIVEKLGLRVLGLDNGKLVRDDKQNEKGKTKIHAQKHEKKKEEHEVQEGKTMVQEESINVREYAKENTEDKKTAILEEHKKETKKLSDLLAKARQTLTQKKEKKARPTLHNEEIPAEKEQEDKQNAKADLPFGFEKEQDVKSEEKKQ